MKDNLELVVNIVGDEQLTHTEIVKRIQEDRKSGKEAIQRWLTVANQKGLLGRVRAKHTRGIEYVYFAIGEGDGAELVANDFAPFAVDAYCPSCGHEKLIKFEGNASTIHQTHSTMTWNCLGCGDYIRLSDCMIWRELLKLWTDWRDSRNPDLDMRLPHVTIGSF